MRRLALAAALVGCAHTGADAGTTPAVEDALVRPDSVSDTGAATDTFESSDATKASVSHTLHAVAGSAWLFYVSVGGGKAHQVQFDTGSIGLYFPRALVGAGATISDTETCSITYVSSGKTLSGHAATAPVALLGDKAAGELSPPPTSTSVSFCAVDDATWNGGMMGVGFGRSGGADPKRNVLLQMPEVTRPGYVLTTHPTPAIEIGITSTRAAGFTTVALKPSTTFPGDWIATSLRGCVSLPAVPSFTKQCGGLLVDTGIAQTILWGPSDKTLGGAVPSGSTTASVGTQFRIETDSSPALSFTFTLGSGASSPSAVDVRNATAFSINTGRALLVDYDYLFDAQAGLVGFQKR